MQPSDSSAPRVPRARLSVSAVFVCHGITVGTWASRVAEIQSDLALSERTLGFALFGFAVGSVGVLPVAGGLAGRRGAPWLTRVGWVPLAIGIALVGQARSSLELAGALVAFGIGLSAVDVGMNASGAAAERALARSVMIGFHAAWSIGGATGALLGGLSIATGVSTGAHLFGVAGLCTLVVIVVSGSLPGHEIVAGRRVPRLAFPSRPLIGLAVVGLITALGEGAATDWAGVVLAETLDAGDSTAAWGYFVFAAAMTVARLRGDRSADRSSVPALVRRRSLLAAAGFVVVAVAPAVGVALVGFALAGLGLAVLIPLAFSVAERVPGVTPGHGVAGVATVSYAAFIVGPPLIGLVADMSSLRWSMGLVALVCAAVAIRPPDPLRP